MDVRQGYKQTEVGVIPDDWNVSTIGSEFSIQLGKMLDSEKNLGVLKPFLGNRAVQWGRFDLSDIGEIRLTPGDLHRFRLCEGDLLVCEGGEIGRAAIWNSPIDECYYQKALHRLRPIRKCNVPFVRYLLERLSSTGYLLNFVTQTSIAHLPKDKFETVPLPMPASYEEQTAIADALGNTDALIESLERLLAKNRQIKQGSMQELLTGKTRLPGFSRSDRYKQTDVGVIPEDWECLSIEAVIDEISMGPFGSDIKTSNFISAGVPVLNGANVASERLDDSCNNFVSFAKAKSLKKAVARRGDVVVTHRGTIGQISYIPEDSQFDRYVVSQSQFRVRFKSGVALPAWIALYFHSRSGSRRLLEGKGHTGVPAIAAPTTTFRKLSVPLPPFPEQQAIADVLFSLDTLISSLEDRLRKARQIRQGMMHELLTGRIRFR